jgi:rhodanese-related sulfurtransferase
LKNLLIAISIIFIFSLSYSQAQLASVKQILEKVDSQIVKITVDNLAEKMELDSTSYLIDIRTEREYLAGHIQNSLWIPRGFLEFKIQKLIEDPEAEIIIYCKGGARSALAAYTLGQMGYRNVLNLEGGIREWVHSGNKIINELGELHVIDFEKMESE